MENIVKTTITFTALHCEDFLPNDLVRVLEECDTGHAVGWVTSRSSVPVPPARVKAELRALGNDGKFFDDDDDDA